MCPSPTTPPTQIRPAIHKDGPHSSHPSTQPHNHLKPATEKLVIRISQDQPTTKPLLYILRHRNFLPLYSSHLRKTPIYTAPQPHHLTSTSCISPTPTYQVLTHARSGVSHTPTSPLLRFSGPQSAGSLSLSRPHFPSLPLTLALFQLPFRYVRSAATDRDPKSCTTIVLVRLHLAHRLSRVRQSRKGKGSSERDSVDGYRTGTASGEAGGGARMRDIWGR